jgi:hypothetical protein
MQRFGFLLLVALFSIDFASSQSSVRSEGWLSLFDGKSLDGWKASDKEGTFSVQDGMIVVHGPVRTFTT